MNKKNMKLNIWWKLCITSAIISILTYPSWCFFNWSDKIFPSSDKLATILAPYGYIILVCYWLLCFPLSYFSVFCIWHWRTRYAGCHHILWPIITVFTLWPTPASPLSGSFLVAFAYFFLHIIPDIRQKGVYATPPITRIQNPATSIPKQYLLVKSACFTIGWSLISLSLIYSIMTLIASFVILDILAARLPELIGQTITKKISSALVLSTDVSKTCIVTNVFCAIMAAIGAIFVFISQNLRWKLLGEVDKMNINNR
jgi:hypothetical protein